MDATVLWTVYEHLLMVIELFAIHEPAEPFNVLQVLLVTEGVAKREVDLLIPREVVLKAYLNGLVWPLV